MSGRTRLTDIFNGMPGKGLSWTTLVDDKTRSVMPEDVRKMQVYDFYRYIGCDILQFGNYGLKESEMAVYPCTLVTPDVVTEEKTDPEGTLYRVRHTPWGDLTEILKNSHPVKHPVETIDEVRILKKIWESSYYKETEGVLDSYARILGQIGDDGVFVPTIELASPVQHLIEYEMGSVNFYYLLQDYREEMEDLMDTMHELRKKEYEMFARDYPSQVVIPVENTSSMLVSPDLYRKYSLRHMKDFVDLTHKYGKKAVIHMCGNLINLLPVIRETGLDGIHALTQPPIGDTTFEAALDILGENTIIIGTMDSTIIQKEDVTATEIWAMLDRIYTKRMREANFVLWLVADGLPTKLEKFLVVNEWMEKNGGR